MPKGNLIQYILQIEIKDEGVYGMENVVINEEKIDDKVLKCFYNICNYYKKSYEIINQFLGVI